MTTQEMTPEAPASIGEEVLFEIVDDHVALVTLNRPEKRNAINGAVAQALEWAIRRVEADDMIRVAILTSSLEGTFSAGADLAEISAGRGSTLSTEYGGFAGFVDAPRTKPWIAAVRGNVLAGGCELTLACDMIVASEDVRFGLPEVKRGLLAAAGGVHRLGRVLPRNVALELVATGDPMPAARAYSLGLINRMVPLAEVPAEARRLAAAIAVNAPVSVRESLRIARLAQELTDAELRILSKERSKIVMATEDAREGPRAFVEKRAPVWKGR